MTDEKCTEPGCDRGWINHQHPLKPPGVSMSATPCPACNADQKKPYLDTVSGTVTVFACGPAKDHACDNLGPEVPLYSVGRNGTEYLSGSSASCSQCGMSAFDRSMWEDD